MMQSNRDSRGVPLQQQSRQASAHAVKAPAFPIPSGGKGLVFSLGVGTIERKGTAWPLVERPENEIEWLKVCAWGTTAPAVQQNRPSLVVVSSLIFVPFKFVHSICLQPF